MKKNIILIITFTLLISFYFSNYLIAVPKNVYVGSGHWPIKEPLKKELKLKIICTKKPYNCMSPFIIEYKYFLKEPIIIEFKIENISDKELEVDFSKIVISIPKDGKSFEEDVSLENKIKEKKILEKGEYHKVKIALSEICKIKEPGTYSFWAYYKLPEDMGISSNDLKIIIEP